jgi:DNA-binding NtrC family response regulator
MVTAKGDEETKSKAKELGADEFMLKGFSFEDLRDISRKKIEQLLGKAGHMQKPRILIVDDEDRARKNLINFITPSYECDIEEAQDGESAIEKVKDLQPDIILLDVRMPGIDGISAISEIKEISPNSRIIVVSGHGTPEVISKAMALGAFDYLVKPLDFEIFPEKFEPALVSLGKLIKKN